MNDKENNTNEEQQPKKRGKRRPRAHGTGSVFQRKDRKGKQWVAQLILENGKTRQRYFNTQGEAATDLSEMLYEQKRACWRRVPSKSLQISWSNGLKKCMHPNSA